MNRCRMPVICYENSHCRSNVTTTPWPCRPRMYVESCILILVSKRAEMKIGLILFKFHYNSVPDFQILDLPLLVLISLQCLNTLCRMPYAVRYLRTTKFVYIHKFKIIILHKPKTSSSWKFRYRILSIYTSTLLYKNSCNIG